MTWVQIRTVFNDPDIVSNIKYKRCDYYIVELELIETAQTNELRSRVIDVRFAKFRGSKNSLVPRRIYNSKNDQWEKKIVHTCGFRTITYTVGIAAEPDGFDENMDVVCGQGIHYFNSLIAAYWYSITKQQNEDVEFGDNGDIRRVQYKNSDTVHSFLNRCGITNPMFSKVSQQFA